MRTLYNALLLLTRPIWGAWMRRRASARGEAPDAAERAGRPGLPPKTRARLWFHAVSVGEQVAARPVLREVRRLAPDLEIVLSVTTSSGHRTAREGSAGLYDHLVYFPVDLPGGVRNALERVDPDVVAVMETELWPNFLWTARDRGARTLVLNGRLSDRSFPRAMRARAFYRSVLAAVDLVGAQSEGDAERFRALGAPRVETLGNCKFDEAAGLVSEPDRWRAALGISPDRPCVVVGSLRAEEFHPRWRLAGVQTVIAPRHVERADELESLFGSAARRSRGEAIRDDLLILDTYGELAGVYAVADVAVVGGGFADLGGQNPLQPLAHGAPVVFGPYMKNFRDVAALALGSGAAVSATGEETPDAVRVLLADPARRAAMSAAARRLLDENVGASERYARAIIERL